MPVFLHNTVLSRDDFDARATVAPDKPTSSSWHVFFYAGHLHAPVKLSVVAVTVNLAISSALIGPLQHGGLALASSIAALTNMSLLTVYLNRRVVGLCTKVWAIYLVGIACLRIDWRGFSRYAPLNVSRTDHLGAMPDIMCYVKKYVRPLILMFSM